jgi:exodeoxyribonuclease V beta subunit
MLIGRGPGTAMVPAEHPLPADDDAQVFFDAWQSREGPVWEESVPASLSGAELPTPGELPAARVFDRTVDTAWRRTSYTALSSAASAPAPDVGVSSEPEVVPRDDEPDGPEPLPSAGHPADAVPSPMAGLPVGATFGSLVHAVLETADPQATDLRAELLTRVHEQLVRWPVELDPEALADALVEVCSSPLGPLAGDVSLRELPLSDRLREMEFELPLAGGDDASYDAGRVRLGDLAPLLRRHLPVGDPLLPYADALADPALGGQDLRGYLTGSVDVVLRVDGRFLVVDYKTNWLGPLEGPLTADDYRPEALAAAMGHSDYPLQALLYAVVLHRYLRWRLAFYDPERHLGGVLYLYLRGMCGAVTPAWDGHPAGVFSWRPPVALVEELSDLLDGLALDEEGAA